MIHGDWALWSFPLSLRDAHPRWSSQSPLPRALPPGHDGTHEGHGQAAESAGRATATPGACSRDPSSRGQLDTEPRETSSPLVIPRRAPRQTLTTAGGRAQALPQHSVRGDQGTAREGPSPCRGHTRHPPQRRAPPLSAPDDLAPPLPAIFSSRLVPHRQLLQQQQSSKTWLSLSASHNCISGHFICPWPSHCE